MEFPGKSGVCWFWCPTERGVVFEARPRWRRGSNDRQQGQHLPPSASLRAAEAFSVPGSAARASSHVSSPPRQVSICLECNSSKLRGLKRKWIRCSAQATVLHLKKFIAKKLNLTSFNEVRLTDHARGRGAFSRSQQATRLSGY